MRPLLAPGVYSFEEQAAPISIPDQVVTLCAMVGLAEMGPMDSAPTDHVDFEDWKRTYGGYTLWNLATVASVRKAFEDGCQVLRFCRTCHHSDASNPASKTSAKATKTLQTQSLLAGSGSVLSANAAPYDLEPGDTLIVNRDVAGNATATFNAVAASRTSANNAPFALVNNDQLTVALDGGAAQVVTFTTSQFVSIGAATAAEVAASINGQITGGRAEVSGSAVVILSDKRGTGSGVNISVGGAQAAGKLNYTSGNVAGTGNVADIDAVSSAEVKTIVELAVSGITVTSESGRQRFTSNTTGGSSLVQVVSTSTADDELGFDNATHTGNGAGAIDTLRVDAKWDGAYANEIKVVIAAPSDGVSGHFNLTVQRNGITIEPTFANLSMVDTDPRYVEKVVNADSLYIAVADLDAAVSFPLDAPATGSFGPLTGGSDGLGSLDDNDFIGGSGANGAVGLSVFEEIEPDVIGCPERATPAVHNALVTFCVATMDGKCFPILETPAGYSDTQVETYFTSTALLKGLSEQGAFYWPRIKVANPSKTIFGSDDLLVVPATGMMMGLRCRVDGFKVGGEFDQPAGSDPRYLPRNVLGLENDAADKKSVRDRLAPLGINVIRHSGRRGPIFVDGSAVLNQDGNWPSFGQRHGINRLRKMIDLFMEIYVQRNITTDLLRDEKATVEDYLVRIVNGGNMPSTVPSEVFWLDFGPGLNTARTKRAMKTQGRIGIATAYPNKFIVIGVGPDTRALEAELAAATST